MLKKALTSKEALELSRQYTEVTDTFGGDVHAHENTWLGLFETISAMRILVIFMYAMVIVFALIVTAMTGSRLLRHEQQDIGIFKALGCTDRMLRGSFALRFGPAAALGSLLGRPNCLHPPS